MQIGLDEGQSLDSLHSKSKNVINKNCRCKNIDICLYYIKPSKRVFQNQIPPTMQFPSLQRYMLFEPQSLFEMQPPKVN